MINCTESSNTIPCAHSCFISIILLTCTWQWNSLEGTHTKTTLHLSSTQQNIAMTRLLTDAIAPWASLTSAFHSSGPSRRPYTARRAWACRVVRCCPVRCRWRRWCPEWFAWATTVARRTLAPGSRSDPSCCVLFQFVSFWFASCLIQLTPSQTDLKACGYVIVKALCTETV